MNTKLHAVTDANGRPLSFFMTAGQISDYTGAAALLVREQKLLTEVLNELRRLMPFSLLGFDTDNDSVFINETIRDYCIDSKIEFTPLSAVPQE